MITEDYVSFETAKLLKEKGFDAFCRAHYDTTKGNVLHLEKNTIESSECEVHSSTLAPTIQMAMKWLRKVYNLFIFISTWLGKEDGTVQYYYEIRALNDFETIADSTTTEFDSPEKTCEAAIKYCLEKLI